MVNTLQLFARACEASNDRAAVNGHPPFTTRLGQETPLNSAPYVYTPTTFRTRFAVSDHRLHIIDTLIGVLAAFVREGVDWPFLLIGGSFLRFDREPTDLDALMVYTTDVARGEAPAHELQRFVQAPRSPLIDLRLCPADCSPMILVKRTIFFSNLFSFDRMNGMLVHGTVMLLPEEDA